MGRYHILKLYVKTFDSFALIFNTEEEVFRIKGTKTKRFLDEMFEFFLTMTLKNPHDVYQLLDERGNSRPVTLFS